MHQIDKLSWEIMNATADDWESLEQIYQALAFDVYAGSGPDASYLRAVGGAPSLREIADRLAGLVEEGYLSVTTSGNGLALTDPGDVSFVWRGWFRMTPEGRNRWQASDFGKGVKRVS